MNESLINRLNHLAQDLENPQQIITVLMAVDELERLYKVEDMRCPCRERSKELEQMFEYSGTEERNC